MEDMNFENKHSTIFRIPTCSNNPLNYTFLSTHPFLWGYTWEMPSLASNGAEIEIKDWRTAKAPRTAPPTSWHPLNYYHTDHSQYILNKWLLRLRNHSKCATWGPSCGRQTPEAELMTLLAFTQKLTQVWGTTAQWSEKHTPSFYTRTQVLPPHFHSKRPPMLTEPPTWKIISGEFKIHSCLILTRTVSSWKERTSIAQIMKGGGRQEKGRLLSKHE